MKTDVIDFIGNYRKYYNYDYNELDFEFNNPDVVNKALIAFSKRKQTVYTLYALEVLIEKLPGICFTGELVRILCENDIGVVALAHKDLDDCCLIIVAGYCKSWLPEPFTRLISRVLKNDTISVAEMEKTYKPVCNYFAVELCLQKNMLYNITETSQELAKIYRLVDWLSEDLDFEDISKKFRRFYELKRSSDIEQKMFVGCDVYEWLGLIQNKMVPLENLYNFLDFDPSGLSYFEHNVYKQAMCLLKFRQYMSV